MSIRPDIDLQIALSQPRDTCPEHEGATFDKGTGFCTCGGNHYGAISYAAGGYTHAWADGFGVWHVRVKKTVAAPLLAARRRLQEELSVRDSKVARGVWMNPKRREDLDDDTTVVYCEGDPE